jgi:uncharacterized damage-inducible protein DinB
MSTFQYESFKSMMFEFLDETFESVQGIFLDKNTSLFETLATISAEQASIAVGSQCATIAAQVKHVAYYLHVIDEFISNPQPQRPNWAVVWETTSAVTEDEWETIRQELHSNYQRIRTILDQISEYPGDDTIGRLMAVVVHTAYHLGEIRQALCTIRI